MELLPEPRILTAERFENSLIITFDDGKFGIFSAHLLRDALPILDLIDEAQFIVENCGTDDPDLEPA